MTGVKIRSSRGCWTCRLRRKKCDETRPICVACMGLQIDCHYSDRKPEWLDGGAREKQKSDELKAMVKQKAMARRERRWAGLPLVEVEADPTSSSSSPGTQRDLNGPDQVMGGVDEEEGGAVGGHVPAALGDDGSGITSSEMTSSPFQGEATPPSSVSSGTSWHSSPPTSVEAAPIAPPVNPAMGMGVSAGRGSSFAENKSEMEVTFTMIYLDYVVPFLFPFYRPCLLESSRGWMLVLLMKNRALFHTALSLASWLYSAVLDGADGGLHGPCKMANWAELQAQQEIAIKALQEDIAALNARGVAGAFREAIGCMQSILQLLLFEVAMADTENWQFHHDAAVVLFDQLITHHADHTGSSRRSPNNNCGGICDNDSVAAAVAATPLRPWESILDRVGQGTPKIPVGHGRYILTSDQSAYRFYTAYLLYIDIMAATALGVVPRLRKYHAELLDDGNSDGNGNGNTPSAAAATAATVIRLDEYVGCHSWAMLELAAVAELAAWKREKQSQGSLSMVELVHRACAIGSRIRWRMQKLDDETIAAAASATSAAGTGAAAGFDDPSGHPLTTPFSGGFAESSAQLSPAVALHTRIWAQATCTYLAIVVSGLNESLPEIQTSVQATISLFRALPSPLALRTLVWPFAVTGCVALPDQQAFFLQLVEDMGGMNIFGTVKEALAIMQNIWEHRGDCFLDPQMCDIATCFSLLGHTSLLV